MPSAGRLPAIEHFRESLARLGFTGRLEDLTDHRLKLCSVFLVDHIGNVSLQLHRTGRLHNVAENAQDRVFSPEVVVTNDQLDV